MSVYVVEVGVALARPPREDARLHFTVEAPSGLAAELVACEWAACHPRVVMPVGSVVTEWEEGSA